MKMKLQSGRGKRAPFTDSSHQLALLGVKPIERSAREFFAEVYESEAWRIERVPDPDSSWLMTRRADGAQRKCSSLIECVEIVQHPERAWGFVRCATS